MSYREELHEVYYTGDLLQMGSHRGFHNVLPLQLGVQQLMLQLPQQQAEWQQSHRQRPLYPPTLWPMLDPDAGTVVSHSFGNRLHSNITPTVTTSTAAHRSSPKQGSPKEQRRPQGKELVFIPAAARESTHLQVNAHLFCFNSC